MGLRRRRRCDRRRRGPPPTIQKPPLHQVSLLLSLFSAAVTRAQQVHSEPRVRYALELSNHLLHQMCDIKLLLDSCVLCTLVSSVK